MALLTATITSCHTHSTFPKMVLAALLAGYNLIVGVVFRPQLYSSVVRNLVPIVWSSLSVVVVVVVVVVVEAILVSCMVVVVTEVTDASALRPLVLSLELLFLPSLKGQCSFFFQLT